MQHTWEKDTDGQDDVDNTVSTPTSDQVDG